MGKISELDVAIRDLRTAATTINDVADTLAAMFSNTTEEPATPTEPELTYEKVRAVLADKSSKGFKLQIQSLLRKHGSAKLSGIDPVHYKALVAEVEVLGNG